MESSAARRGLGYVAGVRVYAIADPRVGARRARPVPVLACPVGMTASGSAQRGSRPPARARSITKTVALALAGGIVIGACAVWWGLGSGDGAVAPETSRTTSVPAPAALAATPTDPDEIERLRAALALERAMREQLTEQVADLEARLHALGALAGDVAAGESGAPGDARERDPGAADGNGSDEPWFDGDALASFGYSPAEIDRLRESFERAVLERLEMENERARSGQRGLHRVLEDQRRFEARWREELGDDGYDAMLYASGDRNRVILAELLERSPAAAAGIEPGDELISYDGERVFRAAELKRLTTVGDAGALVELRVRRAGEIVRLFVERGPLGVRLRMESRPPLR